MTKLVTKFRSEAETIILQNLVFELGRVTEFDPDHASTNFRVNSLDDYDQVIFTVQDLDEEGKPEGPEHVASFWIVTSENLAAVSQTRVDAYEAGLDQLFLIHAQTDLVEVWEKQVTKYGSYDYVRYRWTQYSGSHVELELGHWASNIYDLYDGIEMIEEFRAIPADPSLPVTPNMAEDPENDPII